MRRIDDKRVLRCLYCKNGFKPYKKIGHSSIVLCKCQQYPLIYGILYLRQNSRKTKAISQLLSGNEQKAAISLINFRRRLLYPAQLLLFPSYFEQLTKSTLNKQIYEIFGFRNIIKILTFFSYSREWARYVVERDKMPSFYLSLFASYLTKKGNTVVDFGCGPGHLLPVLASITKPSKVFGVDKSFFNLILARRFFAHKRSLLICCDSTNGLPFHDKSINSLNVTDAFHYLSNKMSFISDVSRIISPSGLLTIIHTLNTQKRLHQNIQGAKFDDIKTILRKVGLHNVRMYSNNSLWKAFHHNLRFSLRRSDPLKTLEKCDFYSFFASKKSLPSFIKSDESKYSSFINKGVNYSWDEYLLKKQEAKKAS